MENSIELNEKHRGFLRAFSSWLEEKRCQPEAVRSRLREIKRFLSYVENNDLNAETLNPQQACSYRSWLRVQQNMRTRRTLEPEAVSNMITFVRSFYRFLISNSQAQTNPFGYEEKRIEPCEERRNLLKTFSIWLTAKGYSPRGIERILINIRGYMEYLKKNNMRIEEITVRQAQMYRDYMSTFIRQRKNRAYDPQTVNNAIGDLRAFYRFLIFNGLAMRNPFSDVESIKGAERIPKNILTIEEMGKLLNALEIKKYTDFKLKALVEIMYSTGARIGEMEGLKREDIRLDEGYIVLYEEKTRKERRAPLTEISGKLLKIYLEHVYTKPSGRVFTDGKRGTLDKWVNKKLRKLCAGLGLPYVSSHGIRHCIATHILKKGADIREVQEYLGHNRIESTEVYTRIFPDDLKEIVNRSHPRETRLKDEAGKRDNFRAL